MYEAFFNLKQKPFDLLPDPDFLFMSSSHKKVLSYLDYGIRERVGFILLTGEVGSGKTTIIRNLIKKNLSDVVLSKIFNTRVDSEQLIAMINDDFGLPVLNKDKITLLRELNLFLIDQFVKGNQPVLIIDEAQNLNHDLLEEIRMLSNLETDNAKLLQIILVGQPELRKTLASATLIQLRQRISINCHIQPLSRSEIELYILHRLEKAGDRDAVSFFGDTIDIIFTFSRGIPRLINIICDFILLAAFAEETRAIDAAMVLDIIGDLDFEYHYWGSESLDGHVTREGRVEGTFPAGPSDPAVSAMIKDLNDRLDNLGKESESGSQKRLLEMAAKIAELEKSAAIYQKKDRELMAEPFDSTPVSEAKKVSEYSGEENSQSFMGNMFGRMFKL
ncbi:MAG: XrtA-associated ATPase [Desulfuromonadaceae bacterium]|nr:XrtA-associated ATPase [Desulfuromonadaceae bacterium]MDD2848928.1 XrtA-associated ATPase [Desulfuromonadaceae bacterium]MDD4131704.1 XrtA-associated ATPase [Desulfuromonadaceae bacterium]